MDAPPVRRHPQKLAAFPAAFFFGAANRRGDAPTISETGRFAPSISFRKLTFGELDELAADLAQCGQRQRTLRLAARFGYDKRALL